MQTVLLANNRLGAEIGRFLADRGDLLGIVLHPRNRQTRVADLRSQGVPIWEWPDGLEEIMALGPECILSVLFGYRVPASWLAVPRWRALNLHPGLLPWNRGCHPNVWPLVDGSPAGTTLHVMEADFDTGDILAQEGVPTYPDDTALSLYGRLETASLLLFRRVWPRVLEVRPIPQPEGGSYHRRSELTSLDLGTDDYPVLDRVRARTFAPYGAEFERDGHRYRVQVHIEHLGGS